MVSDRDYHRAGIPVSLLRCKWQSWTRADLRQVLDHYGRQYRSQASKFELTRELNELCQKRNLTWRDRRRILGLRESRPSLQRLESLPTSQTPMANVPEKIGALPSQTAAPTVSERTTNVECIICLETLNADRFLMRKVTSSCKHEPNICLDCLRQSIASQFTGKIWNQICCPSCNERLEYHDIKAFADTVVFGK